MDHHRSESVTLSWENVNVFVKGKRKKKQTLNGDVEFHGTSESGPSVRASSGRKQILHDVTGAVQPGTLLAVIGASGAGKSTLMNVLSNRNLRAYLRVEGQVKVNGVAVGRGLRHISAYVQQDDLFFSTLTARETLIFRALLRMDNRINRKARLERVEQVIKEMGLTDCANTPIGTADTKKGISGGERKRLSFACEMLTNPPVLFCDEPTSGLDSFMAHSVVQVLQEMASRNRTVLCTIHQPSSEVFAIFHRILLMAEGRVAFMGTSAQAMDFFSSLNYVCPSNFNPSDFFVLTLAIVSGQEEQRRKRVHAICEAYRGSENCSDIKRIIDEAAANSDTDRNPQTMEEAFSSDARYEADWGHQFRTVLWRSWIYLWRNVFLFRLRALLNVVFAVMFGLLYLRQDYDQTGVMNINGALFLVVINISFNSIMSVINSFPAELAVFLREYGSGLYRTDVYFIAKNLTELPTFLILPFIYITIVYWMIGLNETWQHYFIAAGITLFVANVAVSFGLFLSALSADTRVGLAVIMPVLAPFILFSGIVINPESIPIYFIWLKYLSWFMYALEILCVNQWQDISTIECKANTSCYYSTGKDVLEFLSYSEDHLWRNVGALFALLFGFRFLAFLCVFVRARRSRT